MPESIDRETLARMLRAAARRVVSSRDELCRLDSKGGDGDHGVTMARAMQRTEEAIDENRSGGPGALLRAVGWAIMGVDGGATGPLFGSFFLAMADAVAGDSLDTDALARACRAGLAGVQANTRARPGDKTVIDAFEPAVSALEEAAGSGANVVAALEKAASAAAAGARGTTGMRARFGRAKNLGEESAGHQDPGATSVSLIFAGLEEGARTDA